MTSTHMLSLILGDRKQILTPVHTNWFESLSPTTYFLHFHLNKIDHQSCANLLGLGGNLVQLLLLHFTDEETNIPLLSISQTGWESQLKIPMCFENVKVVQTTL